MHVFWKYTSTHLSPFKMMHFIKECIHNMHYLYTQNMYVFLYKNKRARTSEKKTTLMYSQNTFSSVHSITTFQQPQRRLIITFAKITLSLDGLVYESPTTIQATTITIHQPLIQPHEPVDYTPVHPDTALRHQYGCMSAHLYRHF